MSTTQLHRHPDALALAPLLTPFLPLSLALQNALACVPPVPAYATFAPGEPPGPAERRWAVLVDYGNQLRFFAPAEGGANACEVEESGSVVVGALRAMLEIVDADGRQEVVKLGAFHECWLPLLAREFAFLDEPGLYRTFLPRAGHARAPAPPVPAGLVAGPVRAEDIAEVLSTSEVAHPPAYLLSRLPSSTALFTTTTPPRLVAHCFSHRDGSLGTLFVAPAHRRRGLGTLVALLRAEASGGRMLAHVRDANDESRALMRGLGWEGRWVVGWVRVR